MADPPDPAAVADRPEPAPDDWWRHEPLRSERESLVSPLPRDEPFELPTAATPPVAPRRHRALYWAAVMLALAATAGGAWLAVTTYRTQTAPERVVLDYLNAVAAGDAAEALAYGEIPAGARDLLTAEALAAQRAVAPMSKITVDVRSGSGATATAQVTYELGFASGPEAVTDTIGLTRVGRTWRLDAVAEPVTISVERARSHATVAGAEIPAGPHLAFPGALPVAFDNENLTLGGEARFVRFAEEGDPAEVAELSAVGEEAVGAAVEAALATCLDGTAEAPTLCPLPADVRAVPGSLRGSLAGSVVDDTTMDLQPGNDGLVRVSGVLSVTGEYDRLDFNNQRVATTGTFDVEILVVCYATAPDRLIWRVT